MSGEDGFFGELRGAVQTPQRDSGYTAPATDDINTGEAVFDTAKQRNRYGDPGGVQRGLLRLNRGGPARRDEPNDFEWKLQHRMEIRGYAESVAVRIANAGDDIHLKPESATFYIVEALGACTVTPEALDEPVSENPDDPDAPERHVGTSFVVVLIRHGSVDVAFSGVKWSKEFRDGTGADVDSPADPQIDRYVLAWTPGVGWLGELIGSDYQ